MAHTTQKGEAFTWHHVTRPTAADVAFVVRLFGMTDRDAALLATREELPRFYDRGDWHMLRLHVPFVGAAHSAYEKLHLTFVFNKHTVVTIADTKIAPLEKLMSGKAGSGSAGKPNGKSVPRELRSGNVGDVIAWLLNEVFDAVEPILDVVFKKIERLTAVMHRLPGDEATRTLGALRRDVLVLDIMVQPAVAVVAQLIDTRTPYRAPRTTAQLHGIVDRLHAMHAILEHNGKLLEVLGHERELMLSHRTGSTLQFLTIISVLLMPPALVASYYGMNVSGLLWAHDIRLVSVAIVVVIIPFLFLIMRIIRK